MPREMMERLKEVPGGKVLSAVVVYRGKTVHGREFLILLTSSVNSVTVKKDQMVHFFTLIVK